MVIGDIVISMDFDCGKVGMIVEDGWVLNQRICLVRTSDEGVLRQKYLYWLLRFGGFYEKMQSIHTGTTIKHIRGKDIYSAIIKVPSVLLQDATLERLDTLQSQLTALENLGKQAEDNAHFILESYLGSANGSAGSSEVQSHSSSCEVNANGTGCTCRTSEVVQEESKEDVWSNSGSSVNEIIHPVESIVSVAAASSEVNVVKSIKPIISKLKKISKVEKA
jgi:hypothetical protein